MATLQAWINQNPATFDVVAPLKARACGALRVVLNGRRRRVGAGPRIMRRGAERC